MSRTKQKNIFMYAVIFLLVLGAICMMMTVQVQSRTQEKLLFDNTDYRAAEDTYKMQVNKILEAYGCYNSGLTMTHIVSLDGEREYDIQINHERLGSLTEEERFALGEQISACKVVVPGGEAYSVEFLFLK